MLHWCIPLAIRDLDLERSLVCVCKEETLVYSSGYIRGSHISVLVYLQSIITVLVRTLALRFSCLLHRAV